MRKDPKGPNPFKGLLTVGAVAERKQVSQTAVIKAITEGRLPAWDEGFQYWVREQDLGMWEPKRGQGRRTDKE